jgi:hypothetical protein
MAKTFFKIVLLGVAVTASAGSPENNLYNRMGTVNVRAVMANHRDLGRSPCDYCEFLLQSVKYPKVLIGFKTDKDGATSLRLSEGRWRVVYVASCVDCDETDYDLIDRRTTKEIEVVAVQDRVLQIEMRFKK